MGTVRGRILLSLAVLVFVYIIALPIAVGGFSYGARNGAASAWQASVHTTHGVSLLALQNSWGPMGSGAMYSGLFQVGLLALVVLGSIWVLARTRHGQKLN